MSEPGWVAFCVLAVSMLEQRLLLCWTTDQGVFVYDYSGALFMHYIGLRPDWLALVVSGVFCVPVLH